MWVDVALCQSERFSGRERREDNQALFRDGAVKRNEVRETRILDGDVEEKILADVARISAVSLPKIYRRTYYG